jgi:hypothetical protein
LLCMFLSSCCRYHPAGIVSRISQIATSHTVFALRLRARPPELRIFEATSRSLSLRPDNSPTTLSVVLSIGFRVLVSRHPAIPATGLLTFTPTGLTPAEHTSLCWTHNRTSGFPIHTALQPIIQIVSELLCGLRASTLQSKMNISYPCQVSAHRFSLFA